MCVNKHIYAKVLQTECNEKKNAIFIFFVKLQFIGLSPYPPPPTGEGGQVYARHEHCLMGASP